MMDYPTGSSATESNLLAVLLLAGLVLVFLTTRQQPQSQVSLYRNDETWELVRDSEGRLSQIVVHRDAEVM